MNPSPELIIAEVSLITGIPEKLITGRRSSKRAVRARLLAISLIREACSWWSADRIGKPFGRASRTVRGALGRHAVLLETKPEYRVLHVRLGHKLFANPTP